MCLLADVTLQHWVHRIRLYFKAEDPHLYAKRVINAHQSRLLAVQAMRYHLCVDSMPADDIQALTVEQINRILTLALNSKFLRVRLCCVAAPCCHHLSTAAAKAWRLIDWQIVAFSCCARHLYHCTCCTRGTTDGLQSQKAHMVLSLHQYKTGALPASAQSMSYAGETV